MTKCYDCGLPYGGDGWIEAIIPDKMWADISPNGDESGILCINCISKRLKEKGYTTKSVPVELCGCEPLRNISESEKYKQLLNKYCKLVKKYEELI